MIFRELWHLYGEEILHFLLCIFAAAVVFTAGYLSGKHHCHVDDGTCPGCHELYDRAFGDGMREASTDWGEWR